MRARGGGRPDATTRHSMNAAVRIFLMFLRTSHASCLFYSREGDACVLLFLFQLPFAFCVSLSFCVNMHHKVWAGAETCLHL